MTAHSMTENTLDVFDRCEIHLDYFYQFACDIGKHLMVDAVNVKCVFVFEVLGVDSLNWRCIGTYDDNFELWSKALSAGLFYEIVFAALQTIWKI